MFGIKLKPSSLVRRGGSIARTDLNRLSRRDVQRFELRRFRSDSPISTRFPCASTKYLRGALCLSVIRTSLVHDPRTWKIFQVSIIGANENHQNNDANYRAQQYNQIRHLRLP